MNDLPRRGRALGAVLVPMLLIASCEAPAPVKPNQPLAAPLATQRGQWMVYVPVYPTLVVGTGRISLMATLTIHNVTSSGQVAVRSVEYHDGSTDKVSQLLPAVRVLGPLQSMLLSSGEPNHQDLASAAFIVTYDNPNGARAPLVEAVMVGRNLSGKFAFTSRGIDVVELQ